MEELLNSSLGIYWAIYTLFNYEYTNSQWLIVGWGSIAVGLLSFAPRHGRSIPKIRLAWYFFLAFWVVNGGVFTQARHSLAMMMWCVLIGMMLRFSYEVLYNNSDI